MTFISARQVLVLAMLAFCQQKVLVYFLRKEYNDEHFDLQSLKKLCGKTIYFASSHWKNMEPTLANSLKVSVPTWQLESQSEAG